MPGKRLTTPQKRRILTLYRNGAALTDLAQRFRCSTRTISRVLAGQETSPDTPSSHTGTRPDTSDAAAEKWFEDNPPPKNRVRDLSPEALRALRDFPYWCRRYEGGKLYETQKRWIAHADSHDFSLILAPPRHGKTHLFSVLRATWFICGGGYPDEYYDDPDSPLRDMQVLLVSKSEAQAKKNWLAVANRLELNRRLIRDYGRFKDTESIWQSSTCQMTVAGRQREALSGDFSLTVVGAGSAVLGRGADRIVLDDPADLKNCQTPEQATKIMDWLRTEIFSRLEPTPIGSIDAIGARLPVPNDVYDQLEALRYLDTDDEEVADEDDDTPPLFATLVEPAVLDWGNKVLLCPERWVWDRMRKARALAGRLIFEVMWQQNKGAASWSTYHEDWILGRNGYPGCVDRDRVVGQTAPCRVGGVEVGSVRVGVADPSPTKFTGMLLMDVAKTALYRPTLIDIRRDRLPIPLIVDVFDRWWREKEMRVLILERNAAHFLLQSKDWREWIETTDIRVIEHATSDDNKRHAIYGHQTVAVDVEAGRIRIPWGDYDSREQFDDLRREMLGLLPTDDLLDCLWFPKWWLETLTTMEDTLDLGRNCPPMREVPARMARVA